MKKPSYEQDDFKIWLDHPITRDVMAMLKDNSAEAKQQWIHRSWNGGKAELELLHNLRGQAGAYKVVTEMTWEDLMESQYNEYLIDVYRQQDEAKAKAEKESEDQ